MCTRLTASMISLATIVLYLAVSTPALAQSRLPETTAGSTNALPPDRIRLILIQGNDKTREEIILREMKLHAGDKLDPEVMELDRLRIQNLGIFNRVEIDIVPTSTGAILVVSVSEMWYIFPYPIIFRNDRDWGRLSLGAGLLHTNFRGRRETIDFNGWLGFNPAVRLSYSNPWIFGKARFYTKVSIFARRVRNRSFDVLKSDDLVSFEVNENRVGFKWTVGKRFGHTTFLDASVGYRRMTLSGVDTTTAFLDDLHNPPTISENGKDRLPTVGIALRYDSRDLWEYAHKGHYLSLWATKTGFSQTINYVRYGIDVRKYLPIGPTTLAVRAATNLSGGDIPVYEEVQFGFLTRIRGHFRERKAGDNLAIGSAEFRFPILPLTYHDWGPFQGMGSYGTNFRFGVNGGLFADTGNLWRQGESLEKKSFISGWGAGLHIFLPYNALLRFEYAFNEDWDGQFIIDALMTF